MITAVIGAGPAGLLAAVLLAKQGHAVTLFDENAASCGHLGNDRYSLPGEHTSDDWWAELRSALDDSAVSVELSAVVWAAYQTVSGFDFAVNSQSSQNLQSCDQLVLAVGTTDLPLVCPGATLPGVLTARALRILLHRQGVTPGDRFAIVGSGPEANRLEVELAGFGLEAVITLPDVELDSILGTGAVSAIRTTSGEMIEVDNVVVTLGEAPDLQLARMLDLECTFDPLRRAWYPDGADPHVRLYLVGGASVGFATPSDLVANVLEVVETISIGETGIKLDQLPITQSLAGRGVRIN